MDGACEPYHEQDWQQRLSIGHDSQMKDSGDDFILGTFAAGTGEGWVADAQSEDS